MSGPELIDIAREALFVLLKLSSPLMLVGLGVGLIIALFQALTQIQEMTLVFVPKIIAIFITMVFALPYMGEVLGAFMIRLVEQIAAG